MALRSRYNQRTSAFGFPYPSQKSGVKRIIQRLHAKHRRAEVKASLAVAQQKPEKKPRNFSSTTFARKKQGNVTSNVLTPSSRPQHDGYLHTNKSIPHQPSSGLKHRLGLNQTSLLSKPRGIVNKQDLVQESFAPQWTWNKKPAKTIAQDERILRHSNNDTPSFSTTIGDSPKQSDVTKGFSENVPDAQNHNLQPVDYLQSEKLRITERRYLPTDPHKKERTEIPDILKAARLLEELEPEGRCHIVDLLAYLAKQNLTQATAAAIPQMIEAKIPEEKHAVVEQAEEAEEAEQLDGFPEDDDFPEDFGDENARSSHSDQDDAKESEDSATAELNLLDFEDLVEPDQAFKSSIFGKHQDSMPPTIRKDTTTTSGQIKKPPATDDIIIISSDHAQSPESADSQSESRPLYAHRSTASSISSLKDTLKKAQGHRWRGLKPELEMSKPATYLTSRTNKSVHWNTHTHDTTPERDEQNPNDTYVFSKNSPLISGDSEQDPMSPMELSKPKSSDSRIYSRVHERDDSSRQIARRVNREMIPSSTREIEKPKRMVPSASERSTTSLLKPKRIEVNLPPLPAGFLTPPPKPRKTKVQAPRRHVDSAVTSAKRNKSDLFSSPHHTRDNTSPSGSEFEPPSDDADESPAKPKPASGTGRLKRLAPGRLSRMEKRLRESAPDSIYDLPISDPSGEDDEHHVSEAVRGGPKPKKVQVQGRDKAGGSKVARTSTARGQKSKGGNLKKMKN